MSAATLAGAFVVAAPAVAQTPTKQGAAQALFDEARGLFERGEFDAACDKFKASQALDPKGGTLLNLAICREKQGRIASAWTAFAEAKNLAAKEGRSERVTFAENKLRELEPTLPRVQVVVRAAPRGIAIRIDGEMLAEAAWNTAVPIDPGPHELTAAAAEHAEHRAAFRAATGATATVVVPALAPLKPAGPVPATAAASRPADATPVSAPPRWPGWLLAGSGSLVLAVGTGFGIAAFGQRSDAEDLCRAGRCAEGREANDDGVRSAWIANVGIGLGALAIVGGIYLLLRSPRPTTAAQLAQGVWPRL